mmetsp:Transcript_5964/g.12599  ORF Transcript_5964/g.12599 Transcript_5964/m.12599 type:complete len:330 (+) Transcript_5964:95-1084(+)
MEPRSPRSPTRRGADASSSSSSMAVPVPVVRKRSSKLLRSLSPSIRSSPSSISLGSRRNASEHSTEGESEAELTKRFEELNLFSLVDQMSASMLRKTHLFHLKTHRNVVLGSEIVEWLISNSITETVAEAEHVATQLVSGGFLYNAHERDDVDTADFHGGNEVYRFAADDKKDLRTRYTTEQLEKIKAELRENVKTGDRSTTRTLHKSVFAGAEAVSWLCESNRAVSRREAVEIVQILMDGGFIARSGRNDKVFHDDLITLYHFEPEGSGLAGSSAFHHRRHQQSSPEMRRTYGSRLSAAAAGRKPSRKSTPDGSSLASSLSFRKTSSG